MKVNEVDRKNKRPKSTYELKGLVLYTVRAILKNAQGGWAGFSILALTTAGVRNRQNFAAYLRLLEELGWLELEE